MSLFEFMMVLQSIIIGLGISELLGGFARVLKAGRFKELSPAHLCVALLMFLVLLQFFWESWSLNTVESWTYPALLLMLGAPVILFLVTHIIFPEPDQVGSLRDYYFDQCRRIYGLSLLAAIVAQSFRPLAFGSPLFIADNLSFIPTVILLSVLMVSRKPLVHNVLAVIIFVTVLLDVLAINYQIG